MAEPWAATTIHRDKLRLEWTLCLDWNSAKERDESLPLFQRCTVRLRVRHDGTPFSRQTHDSQSQRPMALQKWRRDVAFESVLFSHLLRKQHPLQTFHPRF